MITIPNEVLWAVNKFGTPKNLKGNDATYTLLVRLLLLEPGTFQSHPNMGIGIVSRYRYSSIGEGKSRQLQSDIEDQIMTYLPELVGVKVNVTEEEKSFKIDIEINNILYNFNYNTSSMTLESIGSM